MRLKKLQKTGQNRSYGSYFLIVVILDQITKLLIKSNFNINESVNLISNFLNLTFITNTGSAFGILQGFNTYMIFISMIVLGVILFYWDKISNKEKIFFAFIMGGIVGNLIDRIAYGFVVDFISFSFWPAFNVADSAITIGIILLIFTDWKKS